MTTVVSIPTFGVGNITSSGTYAIEGSLATVNIEGPGTSGTPITAEIIGFSGDVISIDISNNAINYLDPNPSILISDSVNVGENANSQSIGYGTLELASAFATGAPPIVNIFGTNNDIILDSGITEFSLGNSSFGDINPFVATDTIDLQGVQATSDTFTQNSFFGAPSAGGTLVLENNAGSIVGEVFLAAGTYTSNEFIINSSNGGTDITVCFAAGTHILTQCGEKMVDKLIVGDLVVTHGGLLSPIEWIGHRHIDVRRHPRPENVCPIVIEANALENGVPARDLYVSPDHAIYLNEHLIPAKALINGHTIRQITKNIIDYYHVELNSHYVIYAENTLVESYLDTGNRNFFDSSNQIILHPDMAQKLRETTGCAPLVEHGPVVEAVRASLLFRADIETTPDPALTITRRPDGVVVIGSRGTIPGHLSPDPRDRRQLGVKIAAITRQDGTAISLDHPDLITGWHDSEPDGRWTDGYAIIPASLAGEGMPHITVIATLAYQRTSNRFSDLKYRSVS
ncbi:Hint domain-containing protein [Acidiphilium sp.]|uniref:Hint domain-containing protein n=1 Tax=Acidiphilium sp. TaxID=527 RepID=UPI003D002760